jgi:GMP synthase-like glutamine amidotransferase
LLAVTLLLLANSSRGAQTTTSEGAIRKALPIKNATFSAGVGEDNPVKDWVFEERASQATVVCPEDGRGVLLRADSATARGDLVSAPLALRPWQWVEATVEYEVESGSPLLFVCLRPTADASQVSLEFLPQAEPGQKGSASVRLHTGLAEKDYSISVCIMGPGAVRVLSVEAVEAGTYPKLDKPLFVLDIMRAEPKPGIRVASHERLAAVFGFPSIEYVHFTELTRERLEGIDPALVILPGISKEMKAAGLSQNRLEKILAAVRTTVDHGAPVVGLCFGHQVLAAAHGAGGARGREWGPVKIQVVKDDPLFEALPRAPYFYAAARHDGMIVWPVRGARLLASSEVCKSQVFRYQSDPCYSFQCHIESDWENSCPEGYLLWRNMLRQWGLAP